MILNKNHTFYIFLYKFLCGIYRIQRVILILGSCMPSGQHTFPLTSYLKHSVIMMDSIYCWRVIL